MKITAPHTPNNPQIRGPNGLLQRRQHAARLIDMVLDEEMVTSMALNRWPLAVGKSLADEDASLLAAYQILWHFEADETEQQTQPFYLDAQLQLLSQVAQCLAQGQELPVYILKSYPAEHHPSYYASKTLWQSAQELLLQPISRLMQLFRQTLAT